MEAGRSTGDAEDWRPSKFPSEGEFEDSWVARAGDLSEIAATEGRADVGKVRVVEDIEELTSELDLSPPF